MSQKKQNKSTEDSTIEPVDNHDDNGSSGIADVLKVDTYFQLKEEARKAADAKIKERLEKGGSVPKAESNPYSSEYDDEELDDDNLDDNESVGSDQEKESAGERRQSRPALSAPKTENIVKLLDFIDKKSLPPLYESLVLTKEEKEALNLLRADGDVPREHLAALKEYQEYVKSIPFDKEEREQLNAVIAEIFRDLDVEGFSTGKYALSVLALVYGTRLMPIALSIGTKLWEKLME